jgi:hypothetical protein
MNQGASGVENRITVRPKYKLWIFRSASVRQSLNRGIGHSGLTSNFFYYFSRKISEWGFPLLRHRILTLIIMMGIPERPIWIWIFWCGFPGVTKSRINTLKSQPLGSVYSLQFRRFFIRVLVDFLKAIEHSQPPYPVHKYIIPTCFAEFSPDS